MILEEDELPELPDGWKWTTSDDETGDTWEADLSNGQESLRSVGVSLREGILYVYEYGVQCSCTEAPLAVTVAVLKANGVEL